MRGSILASHMTVRQRLLADMATLTDVEYGALSHDSNLADGHAYHHLSEVLPHLPPRLSDIWSACEATTVPEIEHRYLLAYAELLRSTQLAETTTFKIAPTASNSIDMVGALLSARRMRTCLIEPTFDNLSLILRRRGVHLSALPEPRFREAARYGDLPNLLDEYEFDALFLVSPNNPTGGTLDESTFRSIAAYCAEHDRLLVLDHSFRFFDRNDVDDYAILREYSTSFVSFEDTGKVWPTHDLKASLIVFSADLNRDMSEIYNEIYLCHSRFALAILEDCLRSTTKAGLEQTIWRPVDARRSFLRSALRGSVLRVDDAAIDSRLSVEWIDCSGTRRRDLLLTQRLQAQGVMVLPGRQFYWNSRSSPANHHNVRIAMMKPFAEFKRSVERLVECCEKGSA